MNRTEFPVPESFQEAAAARSSKIRHCAGHCIACDIEIIPIERIAEAFARTVKADVKYRFVIDMSTL